MSIGKLKHDARTAAVNIRANSAGTWRNDRVALRMALLRLEGLISSQELDDFCDELGV